MKCLRDIHEQARKGDLLLINAVEDKERDLFKKNYHSWVLCEFEGLHLHHSRWNNIYEKNWREGGDIGYLRVISNALEIFPKERTYKQVHPNNFGVSGFTADGFELHKDPIIQKLTELDLLLYAGMIREGGLITSKNLKDYPKNIWNLWRKPSSLSFKRDVLKLLTRKI